jgi:hypothetical protein
MYLWKNWRDARLAVVIYIAPLIFYLYSVIRHPGSSGVNSNPSQLNVDAVSTFVVSTIGIVLLFVAWSLAGDGIGHEIADDRGAYLLTRPRSRKFFLWLDNGFAFGLMAVLAWSTVVLFEIVVKLGLVRLPNYAVPSPLFFLVAPLCGLIFAGLIYSVTYLCTMLIPRDKTARVISVAVLIAYSYLHYKAYHTWGGLTQYVFPSWWVNPYPNKFSSALAPHLWLELGGRVIAIVVLLLIAQFVLERREIRA